MHFPGHLQDQGSTEKSAHNVDGGEASLFLCLFCSEDSLISLISRLVNRIENRLIRVFPMDPGEIATTKTDNDESQVFRDYSRVCAFLGRKNWQEAMAGADR